MRSGRHNADRDQPVVVINVHALAAGGDGIGPDQNGRMTFVPHAAPGEVIKARITMAKKDFARAELLAVVTPSPDRVEPECALFAERQCGGCQWQHIDMAMQHRAKGEIVARELRRCVARGMDLLPLRGAVAPYRWRRRVRLHWSRQRGSERAVIGFFSPRSHHIVDVERCPQMERAVADVVTTLRTELAPHLGSRGDIEILAGHDGHVHVSITGFCSPKWASRLVGKGGLLGTIVGVALKKRPGVGDRAGGNPQRLGADRGDERGNDDDEFAGGSGGSDGPPRRNRTLEWGKRNIAVEPGLRGRADHFAQASQAGNQALLAAVESACGPRDGKRVVEFYAGAGNLTRILAAGAAELVTTDSRPAPWAVRAPRSAGAAAPAPALTIDSRVGPADEVAEDLIEDGYYFDLAVLDPPRTGASELMAPLLELRPERIVYVSCDPATLARDLDALMAGGYRPISAQPL
ncbi:MAG: TRAM domain-containing protein, partial [Myxococcota bacterium]